MNEFLTGMFWDKPIWMWVLFLGVILVLLLLDLNLFNRGNEEVSVKKSLRLSVFYVAAGCAFGVFVWWQLGQTAGEKYFNGFLIEKSLSLDNIFVISLIFGYFKIPRKYQHRTLFWGILGVVVLRGIMIGLGSVLVSDFHWVLHIFAAFLIFTGVKMLVTPSKEESPDLEHNLIVRLLKKNLRITPELHQHRFVVRLPTGPGGKTQLWATPLLLCLISVEFADLIFAVDSVPAIFSITTDPYLVYSSNIFAILGLRALYFLLAAMIHRFEYLKYAVSLILVFIGAKIFIADFFKEIEISDTLSLSVTVGLLTAGIGFSLYKTRRQSKAKYVA